MVMALLLAGCGASPYHHTNTVAATQVSHTMQFEHNAIWLSAPEEGVLNEFLNNLPPLATEEIVVEGKLSPKPTEARLYGIRMMLLKKHFPREAINIVNSPDMPDDMMTITITTGHVVAPAECPDWSDWSGNNFNNYTYSNFGCAHTINLGQQVAHPYDLIRGNGDHLPDGERNSVAIQQWRSNAPTATEAAGASGSEDAAFSGTASGGEGSPGQ